MYINTLNQYLKAKYGEKIYKVSISGGMTCPNRDGKISTGGCIFCSRGGSGDFAQSSELSVTDQINKGIDLVKKKVHNGKYIAYFQSFTNTYETTSYLEKIFLEAMNHKDVVGISVATRPDCIDNEKAHMMEKLMEKKDLWVELGLQTIHENTAEYIRRGYSLPVFEEAVKILNQHNIDIVVHVIIGLPGETKEDVIKTIEYLNKLDIQGIKLQLLHVLKDTDLCDEYENNKFSVLSFDQYCDILFCAISHLRKDIVIHRMTGDGPKSSLVAPLWSGNKKFVLNSINKKMREIDLIQGREREGFSDDN